MSGFSGINNFGSLTTQSGQKLKFEDFDLDKNGEISKEEYESVLKEMKLDSVELSTVDTSGDKNVSKEEFAVWEQKIEMQNFVNDKKKQITTDFSGTKSQYISDVMTQLREYIDDFAKDFKGDVSTMAESFKSAFDKKYAEIKENVLKNDPSTVKSNILERIYVDLITPKTAVNGADGKEVVTEEPISEAAAKRIAKELEAEAEKFIKNYKGDNLEADLEAHLLEFLNESDSTKLKDAAETFINKANAYGGLVDGTELKALKEDAKEFLQIALEKGVTLVLGGVTIKTTAAINSALNKFSDGMELRSALKEAIQKLSTITKKEQIIADEAKKAEDAAEKAFTDIKGSEYAIDGSIINLAEIPGYADQIHERGKGWEGSKNNAIAKGREFLSQDALKSQVKAQIEKMLSAKGIPFEKIAQVFENVYNQSIDDTLNAEGIITGRGARGLSKKGHAYIDTKALVPAFVSTFNTNIAKAIDEINASDKDMDLYDIDFTQAGKDENGNPLTVDGEDMSTLYANRRVLRMEGRGSDYYQNVAEAMINNMKPQLRKKAQALCEANGVKFDESVFNSKFDNIKLIAIDSAMSGRGGKDCTRRAGVIAAGGAASGVAGAAAMAGAAAAGIGATTATIAGVSLATGPVGWAIGGTVAVATILASIFTKGHASTCSLDTKTLLDTMTQEFKTSYTAWVEKEKASAK